ncbi:MAG TPA: ABC transporter permease subunit [Solirubrobacteraceae bacterium]|jgi:ABC-type transport system involved in multi-copper enzyme maturation permease subunit
MTTLIRAELLQFRSLRSTYAVGLLAVLVVVGITWGDLTEAEHLTTAMQKLTPVLTGGGIAMAFVGALLAAARVAGEYRYGTIANRALATPRRVRLVVAKLATYSLVGLAASVAAAGIGLATAALVFAGKDLTLTLGAADVIDVALRVVVVGTLFAAMGVAIGFITRSQQAAAIVVFGDFFAEKLLGAAVGDVAGYLPFGLLNRLLDPSAGHALATGLGLLATTIGLAAGAAVLMNRRDIQA